MRPVTEIMTSCDPSTPYGVRTARQWLKLWDFDAQARARSANDTMPSQTVHDSDPRPVIMPRDARALFLPDDDPRQLPFVWIGR